MSPAMMPSTSTTNDQEIQRLRCLIAATWGQREAVKAALEQGAIGPGDGLRRLDGLDRELSDLDRRYKTLWDATHLGYAAVHPAAAWAATAQWAPEELDCVAAIMLKVLDGKCKMGKPEQMAIAAIYDVVCQRPGQGLDDGVHSLIARARLTSDDHTAGEVHDWRVRAEAHIPKPVMKAFKQRLRGALPALPPPAP